MPHMEEGSEALVRVKPEPHHGAEQTQEKPPPKPPKPVPKPTPSQPMQIPSNSEENESAQKKEEEKTDEDPVDSESSKGIFGWETVDNTSIPYLLRRGKKFVSVRIVERKLLSKYPNTFPDELGKKDPLVSHFITDAESKLLNEINTDHCDYEYGHNPFTTKDLIVDLDEFGDFFDIVKKTFPAEVLAKMGGEVPLTSTSPPAVKSDLSQFCGWIQINNTVSPYILRFDGVKQVRLVPLSVIVHAAGLLNDAGIDGLLPTPQECAMLNEACKIAGFKFVFAKNTRLISMTEVLQRCQVHLFDLPFKNPLQYAKYIDPSSGPTNLPMKQALQSQPSLKPPQSASPQVSAPYSHANSQELLTGRIDSNPFMPHLARHSAYPPPHLMLPPAGPASHVSQAAAAAMFSPVGPLASLGIDALRAMGPRPRMTPDTKMFDGNALPPRGIPSSVWNMMPRGPPPAHANSNHPSAIPKTPPVTGDPQTQFFPGQGVPQNNIYPKNPSSIPDLAHPIFRGPMGIPPRMPLTQPAQRDNFGPTVRYPPPITGLPPPPQYSSSSSLPFGVNQFKSSLFARTDLQDQRGPLGDAQPGSSHSQHVTRRRSGESPNANNGVNNKTRRQSHDFPSHPNQLAGANNNLVKSDLKQKILACLVNGKSISCLHIDTPTRRGRFCLVEAVSKLYFPAVPLQEFVKVLQAILKVNLLECSPEEEAAFVQYYNLPVSKLKCNKIIAVDDLDKYFPQLNYMFTKNTGSDNSSNSSQGSVVTNVSTAERQKRSHDTPLSGPPSKQIVPSKVESVVQKLQHNKGHEHMLGGE
ncbi:hypothetical protein ElyMa_001381200 [Elysia marginata]|uniref:Uncharacterized protein n=1 Tax=Elysia marginata TaxID=1093978 RepID=A0AAV4ITW4_9GAST|nr:hypothetical protein ElyMa_001381200 [Elysia marginata]